MDDLLNRSQRIAVSVSLRAFEASLRHALEWLAGKEVDGILYRASLHLPDGKPDEIRREIAAALDEIAAVRRALDLETAEEDAAGLLRGEMAVAWANLLDTRSRKLRGYGEVHPSLAGILDPPLLRLSRIAAKLAENFGPPEREEQSEGQEEVQ